MYAGTSNGELYQSFDYGATWYLRYTFGSASDVINLQCSLDGQKVIAINGSLLYLSEDAGQTFTTQARQSFYALSSDATWCIEQLIIDYKEVVILELLGVEI